MVLLRNLKAILLLNHSPSQFQPFNCHWDLSELKQLSLVFGILTVGQLTTCQLHWFLSPRLKSYDSVTYLQQSRFCSFDLPPTLYHVDIKLIFQYPCSDFCMLIIRSQCYSTACCKIFKIASTVIPVVKQQNSRAWAHGPALFGMWLGHKTRLDPTEALAESLPATYVKISRYSNRAASIP